MAGISAAQVKELRTITGAGIMECKDALKETEGNIEKAVENLRKKGMAKAAKKASREVKEGMIGSYIHHTGKTGVMIELNCETDFVARTDDFKELSKNLCMQIAAMKPLYVKPEDVPAELIEKEKEIYADQMKASGKPEKIIEKIVDGKIKSYYEEICLLNQKFFKENKMTMEDYIKTYIAKLGENITVGKFIRFEIGGN